MLHQSRIRENEMSSSSSSVLLLSKDEKTGQLRLNKDGMDALARIEAPLAVCLIAGPYRSGKSYLMNKLFTNSNKMKKSATNQKNRDKILFPVGHLDQSQTKGVWLSDSVLTLNQNSNQPIRVIFMDTEGLESRNNESWDKKLFLISVLMSSLFIYNTKNALSNDAFAKLSSIAESVQRIKLDKNMAAAQTAKNRKADCPDLLWLVRDFSLKQTKSADDAFKEFLQAEEKPDRDDFGSKKEFERISFEVDNRNEIRESLLGSFRSHSCFYLRQPELDPNSKLKITHTDLLKRLDKVEDVELSGEFRADVDKLADLVTSLIKPKCVRNTFFDGKSYVEYLRVIVEVVNSEKTIYLHDAMRRIQMEEEFGKIKSQFTSNLMNLVDQPSNTKPMSLKEFEVNEKKAFDECKQLFQSKFKNQNIDEYLNKFETFRIDSTHIQKVKLIEKINDFNQNHLASNWNEQIEKKLSKLEFKSIGEFDRAVQAFKATHLTKLVESGENSGSEQLWQQFTTKINIESKRSLVRQVEEKEKEQRRREEELRWQVEEERRKLREREEHLMSENRRKEDENRRLSEQLSLMLDRDDDERYYDQAAAFSRLIESRTSFPNSFNDFAPRLSLSNSNRSMTSSELHLNKDGSLDMRYRESKKIVEAANKSSPSLSNIKTLHFKKDGTLDMRYKDSKQLDASFVSSFSSVASDSPSIHLKSNGTPDMRYKENRPHSSTFMSSTLQQSFADPPSIHLKSNGTPDMRYKENRQSINTSFASASFASPSPAINLKSNGTPDMRYKENRQYASASTSNMSSMSRQQQSFTASGPLKANGTPDMRYASNKAAFGGRK